MITWRQVKEQSSIYKNLSDNGVNEKELRISYWKYETGFKPIWNELYETLDKNIDKLYKGGRLAIIFHLLKQIDKRNRGEYLVYSPKEIREALGNANYVRALKWLIDKNLVLTKRDENSGKIKKWKLNIFFDTWDL